MASRLYLTRGRILSTPQLSLFRSSSWSSKNSLGGPIASNFFFFPTVPRYFSSSSPLLSTDPFIPSLHGRNGFTRRLLIFSRLPILQISNKEIHLKHGKLHAHHDVKQNHEEDHVVYKYRWLGDDIVKTENDFEGEEDDEYADKEGKVKLPGGCELTEKQYLELESFKKETYYVKKW